MCQQLATVWSHPNSIDKPDSRDICWLLSCFPTVRNQPDKVLLENVLLLISSPGHCLSPGVRGFESAMLGGVTPEAEWMLRSLGGTLHHDAMCSQAQCPSSSLALVSLCEDLQPGSGRSAVESRVSSGSGISDFLRMDRSL